MKTLALLALLLTGCCAHYVPTPAYYACPAVIEHTILNNTGIDLIVVQDGAQIARLDPGQTLPLRPIWGRTTSVNVSGFSPDQVYRGANSYIFKSGIRETWVVSYLLKPGQ